MSQPAITDETRFIRLTTFRRSGDLVPTPVWVAELPDGAFGFYTASGTGKVKRLRHTERVLVQASDFRGKPLPGSREVEVRCALVDGADLAQVRSAIVGKYGRLQTTAARWGAVAAGFVRHRRRLPYADVGVRFRLPD